MSGICLADSCPWFRIGITKQEIRVAEEFDTELSGSHLFECRSTVKFFWVSKISCQTVSVQNWEDSVF